MSSPHGKLVRKPGIGLGQPLNLVAKNRHILIVDVHEVENHPKTFGKHALTVDGNDPMRNYVFDFLWKLVDIWVPIQAESIKM